MNETVGDAMDAENARTRPTQPSIDVIPAGSSADKRLHIQWKARAEKAERERDEALDALARVKAVDIAVYDSESLLREARHERDEARAKLTAIEALVEDWLGEDTYTHERLAYELEAVLKEEKR